MGIKDDVSNDYMSDNEHFADVFNYFIHGGEKIIKPEDLTSVNATETVVINRMQKLLTTKKTRDVIKGLSIKQGENITYVLLGVENQSMVHYAMPVRALLYDALNYTAQVSEEQKRLKKTGEKLDEAEYLSGFAQNSRIYPVLTLVINWSDKRWDGPHRLSEMFAETDKSISDLINDYELNLIDPHDIDDFDRFNTALGDVLEFIKYQNDEGYLERTINQKGKDWSLDIDSVNVINTFTGADIPIIEEEGTVNMCRATKVYVEQGIEQGIKAFILDKVEDGIEVATIIEKVMKRFDVDKAKAEEYYRKYSKQQ